MVTEMILNPIGKGQITIPLAWRKIIGIDGKKEVKAILEGNRVIIEPVENDIKWDIDLISLDKLNKETRDAIKIADENYKAGKMDKFLSFNEVFGDV